MQTLQITSRSMSIAIRTVLFLLLFVYGIEANPGPVNGGRGVVKTPVAVVHRGAEDRIRDQTGVGVQVDTRCQHWTMENENRHRLEEHFILAKAALVMVGALTDAVGAGVVRHSVICRHGLQIHERRVINKTMRLRRVSLRDQNRPAVLCFAKQVIASKWLVANRIRVNIPTASLICMRMRKNRI